MELVIISIILYSTYNERYNCTPSQKTKRGNWSGQSGESMFIPSNTLRNRNLIQLLHQYGLTGITYKNCIVDFSDCSICQFYLKNMSILRYKNFREADLLLLEYSQSSQNLFPAFSSLKEIQAYRSEQKLTWHECNDCRTIQLIPSEIHRFFNHLGGISELKHIK